MRRKTIVVLFGLIWSLVAFAGAQTPPKEFLDLGIIDKTKSFSVRDFYDGGFAKGTRKQWQNKGDGRWLLIGDALDDVSQRHKRIAILFKAGDGVADVERMDINWVQIPQGHVPAAILGLICQMKHSETYEACPNYDENAARRSGRTTDKQAVSNVPVDFLALKIKSQGTLSSYSLKDFVEYQKTRSKHMYWKSAGEKSYALIVDLPKSTRSFLFIDQTTENYKTKQDERSAYFMNGSDTKLGDMAPDDMQAALDEVNKWYSGKATH